MDVTRTADDAICAIAAAIGEPARARILYCLMADRARTSTELAAVAEVSPSTASAHLARLKEARLVRVVVQGKHRYYSLWGADVAAVLESLSVLAGAPRDRFAPSTPEHLRSARTCYDHMAGTLGVHLHDRLMTLAWLEHRSADDASYDATPKGVTGLEAMGIDVRATRALRRRFAFPCLDWSERRSHVGGALGAALLTLAVKKRWVAPERDSRALRVTALGTRELATRLGVRM